MPAHYKIPTKPAASREKDSVINNTTTNVVTSQHEAAAKAFLTETLGNCGRPEDVGSTPYNPMDYYEEPDWNNTTTIKADIKPKNNEPVGNI